jgi:WD40 repeat protein
MKWYNGTLYSGGKDGCVVLTSTADFQVQTKIDFGNLVRAVDFNGTNMVVGLRNGTIIHCGADGSDRKEIMHSHNNGEVWGLSFDSVGNVYTSGDDNQVITWDPIKRGRMNSFAVSERKAKSKKGGASKLCKLPDSQCSRAVAVCGYDIAVAGNDGAVSIKDRVDGKEKYLLQDSDEWIEVIHYSPDEKKLAVGSHDNNIYIYDVDAGYVKCGVLKGHTSYITNLDWSADSSYIRSNCGAYELLFFKMDDCSQDPSGRSNTTGVTWATETAKFSWNVEGIFPSGTDGTHINGVNGSKSGMLIAAGDDYGLVQIYRNPAREGAQPRSMRGHSEHVTRVAFSNNDDFLFSIGGYDQTLMQWKKC